MRSGALTGNDTRWRSASSGSPLPEQTVYVYVCVSVDTDEIQPVFAGSALWLDCTALVHPIDSLLQVSWYRDHELLYYQYVVNGRLVNYPPNSTAGFMFHARASSQSAGQLTVWPVAPGEGGVYSCHVIMSGSDVQPTRTIAVFVCESFIQSLPVTLNNASDQGRQSRLGPRVRTPPGPGQWWGPPMDGPPLFPISKYFLFLLV